jgi:hypothetical protein
MFVPICAESRMMPGAMNQKYLPQLLHHNPVTTSGYQKTLIRTFRRWRVMPQGISIHSACCHGWPWQRVLFWVMEVFWWRTKPVGRAGAWDVAWAGAAQVVNHRGKLWKPRAVWGISDKHNS